jgi:hypothetical protein
MHCRKQSEPVFGMAKATSRFPTWKIVIEAFRPVLYVLHYTFNDAFPIRGMGVVLQIQEPAGLRIKFRHPLKPDASRVLAKPAINLSATNMFLSLDMDSARIRLFWLDGNP